jgi:hypothetical protein
MTETPEDLSPEARTEQERAWRELQDALRSDTPSLSHGVIADVVALAGATATVVAAAAPAVIAKMTNRTERERIAAETKRVEIYEAAETRRETIRTQATPPPDPTPPMT